MVFYVLGMVLYFLGMLTAKVRLYLSGTTNEHKSVQTEVAQVNIHLVLVVVCVD